MSKTRTCWTCGHWIIGAGCWKDGQYKTEGWKDTGPNDSCEGWVEEGADGTITEEIDKAIERGDNLE